jgi:hypothetical protein
MVFNIIVIDKKGTIHKKKLNSSEQLKDIYKKCCTSRNASPEEYPKITTWELDDNNNKVYIDLYGKQNGRAGFENKYELPPPVDKMLLFNSFALVKYTIENEQKQLKNLSPELWKKYYEELMGGFEELNDEDESEEDELSNIPKENKTKNGYLKDGFVIEDEDGDTEDDDSDDDENDDENNNSMSNMKKGRKLKSNQINIDDEEIISEACDSDSEEDNDEENMEFEDDENDNELTYEEYSESESE